MSRWIEVDAFVADSKWCGLETAEQVLFALDHQPSIDLVTCAECKYKKYCGRAVEHTTYEPTSITIDRKSVNSCSYGRRENE